MQARHRIALTIFVTLLAMVGLILWQTTQTSLEVALEQVERTDNALIGAASHLALNHLITEEYEDFQSFSENLVANSHATLVFLVDGTGEIVSATDLSLLNQPVPRISTNSPSHRHMQEVKGASGPLGFLYIDFSNQAIKDAYDTAFKRSIGIAVVGIFVVIILSIGFGNLMSRRLEKFSRAVHQFATGDLSVRADIPGNDEIASMSRVFNNTVEQTGALISNLERREKGMRELYTNVAANSDRALLASTPFLESFAKFFNASHAYLLQFQVGGEEYQVVDYLPQSLKIDTERAFPVADALFTSGSGLAEEVLFITGSQLNGFRFPGEPQPAENLPRFGVRFTVDKKRHYLMLVAGTTRALELGDEEFVRLLGQGLSGLLRRTELEQYLSQAQKMEAVGQLTGGIAHDFNNLLAVIMGNLELATMQPGLSDKVIHYLANVQTAADRAAALIQRLLAFSRKQVLKPDSIHLGELVRGMVDMLQRSLAETIELEFIDAAGLWKCEADPGQVENAVLNLAINARDAMPNGGKLTIETANIRLDEDYTAEQVDVPAGQYVLLAVTDTGMGMGKKVLDQVFDPFFTTKNVGKGSGLGLSMVFGFVKQSRGHISIYSEVGQGTTVRIYLPKSKNSERSNRQQQAKENPMSQGESILVVEDNEELLKMTVALLTELNYSTRSASDASQAIEVLNTSPDFNLLLTDVVLPGGKGGRELADEVSARYPDLKVLYMSGYTENAIIHHDRLDEGVVLLNKPFRKDQLAAKVREALNAPGS